MAFDGFPAGLRSIPVPAPVFGPLLEQIDDLDELKCTLRIIWLLHHKRGHPRFVTVDELLADRILVEALGSDLPRVRRALERAEERGTLASVTADNDGRRLYVLNTSSDRSALASMAELPSDQGPRQRPWEGVAPRPDIFALYEDNIGMLSPIIAEELREAEQLYPAVWIADAFRESVAQNKRNWRYIARILERWEREGRSDGQPGRYPKAASRYKEYFQR